MRKRRERERACQRAREGGQDTWLWDEDCDDNDPHTYPGAAEQDSETDCMRDFDGDGFGDSAPEQSSVVPGTDCDDSDANVNPEAGGC